MSRSSEHTYTPAWWVPGAHLQTLWGKFGRRPPVVDVRAERWATPDGDELEVRRLDPPLASRADRPRLLVLHGLEGTFDSHYVRGIVAEGRTRDWGVDVLLFRSCGSARNRARRMYHSGETADLDLVVRRILDEDPLRPCVAVGFSLGGNVLLKWLGEQGTDVPERFRAAAAVSVPFDLARGSRHLERGMATLYARHFLKTLVAKARTKLRDHPGAFDAATLERVRSLYEFDDAVTAPLHGFADAADYYRRSSSMGFLPRIRRPTLLLSAADDPFLPADVLEEVAAIARNNPLVTTEFVARGGHVGFVGGRNPFRPRYYAEVRALDFLQAELASTVHHGLAP